jgi:inhibitor of cysteine peptidase
MQREVNKKIITYGISAILLAVLFTTVIFHLGIQPFYTPSIIPLNTFSSFEELENFLKTNVEQATALKEEGLTPLLQGGDQTRANSDTWETLDATSDYSQTNVQVEGVDEADTVKTDGEYLYVVSNNTIFIVKAYPPETAQILSKIPLNQSYNTKIYIDEDKLAVLGSNSWYMEQTYRYYYPYSWSDKAFLKIYDISNRSQPTLTRNLRLNGSISGSRRIDDYIYIAVYQSAIQPKNDTLEQEVILPKIQSNDTLIEVQATEVRYVNMTDSLYYFTTIISVNIQDDAQEPTYESFLTGSTSTMYVSRTNMYLVMANNNMWIRAAKVGQRQDETLIYRVKLDQSDIVCEAYGAIPGYVLNQFSMDEYDGIFRVATTRWTNEGTKNNVYTLNMTLHTIGKLEDLAPGEQIYSARFIADRCYLVTFRQIDPFYVIDLETPTKPKILGYLKIPGFSGYLHPYDSQHIIGVGMQDGNVKLSLFNVTDVTTPTETAKYIISASWSNTPVLNEHKAFLFSETKQLLALPITTQNSQGAYIFNITLNEGFKLKGSITHRPPTSTSSYVEYSHQVQRIIFIENTLYTISQAKIKMNHLDALQLLNEIDL